MIYLLLLQLLNNVFGGYFKEEEDPKIKYFRFSFFKNKL